MSVKNATTIKILSIKLNSPRLKLVSNYNTTNSIFNFDFNFDHVKRFDKILNKVYFLQPERTLLPGWRNGRRSGLKIHRERSRGSSSLPPGTRLIKLSGVYLKKMPNKKSAERRVRIAERNRLYNKHWSSMCKTVVKRLLETIETGNVELATEKFNNAQSVIDKAVVKGVMHKNTANRRKIFMAKHLKAMAQG